MLSSSMTFSTNQPENNYNIPDHHHYKEKTMINKKVLKSLIMKSLDWLIFIGLLSVSVYVMKESIDKFIEKASTFEISSEGIHTCA